VTSFTGAALRDIKETKSIKSDFIMIFFFKANDNQNDKQTSQIIQVSLFSV